MADASVPNVQISLPFTFGPSGGISTTDSLVKQLADHVYSAVGTQQGERVMRSAYGTTIMPHLFGSTDDVTEQEITQTISEALAANVPEVVLQTVDYSLDPSSASLDLTVNYGLATGEVSQPTTSVSIAIG